MVQLRARGFADAEVPSGVENASKRINKLWISDVRLP